MNRYLVIGYLLMILGAFLIGSAKVHAEMYIYTLSGPLYESNDKVSGLNNLLRTLDKHDYLLLRVNSGGGHLHVGKKLMDNINDSSAYIVTENIRSASSSAMPIALMGDCILLNKDTIFVFHRPVYRHDAEDKNGNRKSIDAATDKEFIDTLYSVAPDFMSPYELTLYYKGKDIVYTERHVKRRLQHRICK